jgi:carbamoyl-phosphate synthase large subunit
MKTRINILFLGGAKRVSLAELFIKNGSFLGVDIGIFSYELDPYVPIAEVAEVIVGKKWSDNDLMDHLVSIIRKYEIDIVLPFVDPSILVCAELKKHCDSVFVPVSTTEVANVFYNKITADEWFSLHNIPRPVNRNVYPLIAKPVTGSASKGLVIINSEQDWDSFNSQFDSSSYLIQQFIKGIEFSVDCYVNQKGQAISIVPRLRLEVTSGESTKTVTVKNDVVIELSKKIIDTGFFIGPITIQFIQDEITKAVYVMEINPRFGGAVLCSIAAGADSTVWILKEFLNLPIEPLSVWMENTIMSRSFREYYFYANSY